ncbi:MAG: polyphosphate kinase 1 [Selenomonadaceae bacterium]|nr:polyphosphate kinase 1 [Selenomonadaceae bacterium]
MEDLERIQAEEDSILSTADNCCKLHSTYTNRELSWLSFNERVLEEAAREGIPLANRLNYLAIYQSNLDEFFRVRVGALTYQSLLPEQTCENKTGLNAREQLAAIMAKARELNLRKEEIYRSLRLRLAERGIRLLDMKALTAEQSKYLVKSFKLSVARLLSPVVVGKRKRLPFFRNYGTYAVARLRGKKGKADKTKLGIVYCGASALPRLISVPWEEKSYVLTDELVLYCLPRMFKKFTVEDKALVRVTRNADIRAQELLVANEDYRAFMTELMKKRNRLMPVRLEATQGAGEDFIRSLCADLRVAEDNVFFHSAPLNFAFFYQLQDHLPEEPTRYYRHRFPQRYTQFRAGESILSQVRQRDRLLSYPYDSMEPFLDLLHEAAEAKAVEAIRMTLYRLAPNSRIVELLIMAAENGKRVEVLLELKARFDEENNIRWSRRLEQAGCKVVYGLSQLKVHAKLCLISGKEEDGPFYISYVGTGNFNEKTAQLYTDYGLLTARSAVGQAVERVFCALMAGESVSEAPPLLAAPHGLQRRMLELMEQEISKAEAGRPAYIGIKINALTDKKIIDQLIMASKAGVQVELLVRGICCLKPGIPGETENIRVVSVVGRFLEHSRVYIFGQGETESIFISSADFMTRNAANRVEVALLVLDAGIKEQLRGMFRTMMRDNYQAWEQQADGSYQRVSNTAEELNSQEYFFAKAYEIAAGRK